MSAGSLFPTDASGLARIQRGAILVGVVGLVACVILALIPDTRPAFFRSWLVAFNYCLGFALGALVVLMLQYLTGGTWGFVLRRPLEAATRTLPLLALLFVPLAFGLTDLYAWADPAKVDVDKDLQHKAPYLNVPFFLIRAAIYFAIWNVLQFLLNRLSKVHDETNDPAVIERCQALSAAGIILYVLTITFASIDWVMSLEPHWYSTIYGALFGMGQVLSGFAFTIVVFLLVGRPPLDRAVNRDNLRDHGSLLLAFVMVWAYLAFDQFLLIWSGNLPEEVPWYIARLAGPWKYVALALVLLMFAAPFILLLSADRKRSRNGLARVALLVVGMRLVELLWLIVPAFHHGHGHQEEHGFLLASAAVYVPAIVGVGGVWLGVYLWQLQQRPLLPLHSPEGGADHGEAAHH
jgi:hypothetical protein